MTLVYVSWRSDCMMHACMPLLIYLSIDHLYYIYIYIYIYICAAEEEKKRKAKEEEAARKAAMISSEEKAAARKAREEAAASINIPGLEGVDWLAILDELEGGEADDAAADAADSQGR